MTTQPSRPPKRVGLLGRAARRFNGSPTFQYKLHLVGTIFWVINFPVITFIYFATPGFWHKFSIFYLALITFYGNFSTDYCGVSDAEASGQTAALRGMMACGPAHHRALSRLLTRLGTDPRTQYRLHLWLSYIWLYQGIAAVGLFVFAPTFWNSAPALFYVMIVNLYTCLGTDFSALPGTLAAAHATALRGGRSPWDTGQQEVSAGTVPPP